MDANTLQKIEATDTVKGLSRFRKRHMILCDPTRRSCAAICVPGHQPIVVEFGWSVILWKAPRTSSITWSWSNKNKCIPEPPGLLTIYTISHIWYQAWLYHCAINKICHSDSTLPRAAQGLLGIGLCYPYNYVTVPWHQSFRTIDDAHHLTGRPPGDLEHYEVSAPYSVGIL